MEAQNKNQMTFEDFADGMEEWISTRMAEMYYEGGLDTLQLYESVIDAATQDGVKITDADTFGYDPFFAEWYNCIEKGPM